MGLLLVLARYVGDPPRGDGTGEHESGRHGHIPGDRERGAPTDPLDQPAGHYGRHGDAEAAEHPVDAESPATSSCTSHDPRDPHRMVDRGEETDRREAGAQLRRRLSVTGKPRGCAQAEEQDSHHARSAPAIGDPAGGQCAQADEDRAERPQLHEIRIRSAPIPLQVQDDDEVEGHEVVSVEVADAGERDRDGA